jgi:transposase, IS5 family
VRSQQGSVLLDRIHRGDTRSEGKLLSVFEPSAEIIRKGKSGKPNEFGKMVKLQEAENQIVIEFEVYDRRPSDADLLVPAIDAHQAALGRPPTCWRQTPHSIPARHSLS